MEHFHEEIEEERAMERAINPNFFVETGGGSNDSEEDDDHRPEEPQNPDEGEEYLDEDSN